MTRTRPNQPWKDGGGGGGGGGGEEEEEEGRRRRRRHLLHVLLGSCSTVEGRGRKKKKSEKINRK
jgi:hypothetical protein